jgi:hypothetical protein
LKTRITFEHVGEIRDGVSALCEAEGIHAIPRGDVAVDLFADDLTEPIATVTVEDDVAEYNGADWLAGKWRIACAEAV